MASLPAPAAEMVKSLDPRGTAVDDLTPLDSTGDELFVQFFNTNQNVGEKASDDLHRLYSSGWQKESSLTIVFFNT